MIDIEKTVARIVLEGVDLNDSDIQIACNSVQAMAICEHLEALTTAVERVADEIIRVSDGINNIEMTVRSKS